MVNVLEALYAVTALALLIAAVQLARGRRSDARRFGLFALIGIVLSAIMYWYLGRAA